MRDLRDEALGAAPNPSLGEGRAECVERQVDLPAVPETQSEEARRRRLAQRAGRVDVEQQPAGVVPLGRVRAVGRVGTCEPADRGDLAVLPAARVAARSEPPGADMDQRQRVRGGRLVEGVAEQRLVRDREGRLQEGGERRVLLEHRRLVGPLVGPERANLREDAVDLGQPEAEQVEEDVTRPDLLQLSARTAQVGRREAAEEATVDQHETGEIAVARAAAEIPGGIRHRRRCARGVAAEDHLTAAAARVLDDVAQVLELLAQTPLGHELRVRAEHPPVLEAQVVVLRRRRVAAREHRRVLECLLAAVDDPDLGARNTRDDVAGDRRDAAGAAVRPRHEHDHAVVAPRPQLLHVDAVVLRRSRACADLDGHVAVDRRRGSGSDQQSEQGQRECESHAAQESSWRPTSTRVPRPRAGRVTVRAPASPLRRSRAARPRHRPRRPRRPLGSRGRRPRSPARSRWRRS